MSNQSTTKRGQHAGLMVAIVAIVGFIDQLSKLAMLELLEPGMPLSLLGDWVSLFLTFNPGAAFGMGEGSTWLFTTLQLVFVVATLVATRFVTDQWEAVGFALIGGGALGNLIDRLTREPGFWFGHVVDFISVRGFAVFNVADSAITIGVVVFILATMTEGRRHAA